MEDENVNAGTAAQEEALVTEAAATEVAAEPEQVNEAASVEDQPAQS